MDGLDIDIGELVQVDDVDCIDDNDLADYVFQFEKSLEDGVCIGFSDCNDDGPSMAKVLKFCKDQEKVNTRNATDKDVRHFSSWLAENKFELRLIELIPPKELSQYMAQYFVFVRKPDGNEYQPGSLLNMFHSFHRYLTSMKYFSDDCRINILRHEYFEDCRLALQSKRRELKKKGLGNRPHRSIAVEEDEENIMWEKGVLGGSTPFSLQFSLWFYLTLLCGLRGRDEHRAIRFGDIKIKKDAMQTEYLEMNERSSKTRDGSLPNDTRETSQKIFCSCKSSGQEHCVIELWKQFVSRRPEDFCGPEDPLYLQTKTEDQIRKSKTEIWYKHQPLGANSLGKFLPKACQLAGLAPRGNHGVRATTVQRLRKADIPDDHIIQITGHKSVQTLAVYDTNQLSSKVHQKCQQVLQKPHTFGSASEMEAATSDSSVVSSCDTVVSDSVVPSSSSSVLPYAASVASALTEANVVSNVAIQPSSSRVQSMFSGAVFNQCVFNLAPTSNENANNEQ